ncbi:adenylosuccinate synthetase [Actinoplanes sp. NBRC 103695]|uniref:adenylosuccinate synthetase n=1 Tax=Actinoplanes sp. NBRC 103695 TaxID=3032202 RepID=UPI0024A1DBAD|nr:adenylosuccinate synthetase [Actinoplanes sp. NBRC 103695]GLZ01691.1 adenylosuccinate synthetase [Actinoplanes sp. NBRC 103695]
MTRHIAVVDLGYGDAGKGSVVDALCATAPRRAVLRFNGGAQAAHNVITASGRHHTFAQFGSGTLQGVPTHLTRFMVVDPLALSAEASALGNPYHLLTVDEDALLATPWHRAANQVREQRRGAGRHGSCGMGVGQTMAYALKHPSAPRVGDVRSPARLRARLAQVRSVLTEEYGPLPAPPLPAVVEAFLAFGRAVSIVDWNHVATLLREGPCIFEGAQGVLLDEWRGWHPYTTWSTTTFGNVAALCDDFLRLGVVRTYTTRHGAGPFVTEAPLDLPEAHNGVGEWQGTFRVGHFDAVAHRYAVEVCGGVDGLAVTHLDVASPALQMCTSYEIEGARWDRIAPGEFKDLSHQSALTALLSEACPGDLHRPADWPAEIGAALGAPVLLESHGPATGHKKVHASLLTAAPKSVPSHR